MEYRQLGRTPLKLSSIGFGCGPLGGEYGPIDEEEGVRSVRHAIQVRCQVSHIMNEIPSQLTIHEPVCHVFGVA
jgi:predicted aldo/keto reductase-like oxidoreductase